MLEKNPIRILTWNIHKGIGGVDRRYQLERTIEILRDQEPDIALLQEVAQGMPRAHRHDQADLLAEVLEMPHVAHAPQHRFRIGGYGNAILSRWPLHDIHPLDLTVGRRKRRGALHATLRARVGGHSRTLVVWVMHLGLAGSERAQQLQRFLASHPFNGVHHRTPMIVGGDLNDVWGTLGPRFFEPAGFARAGSRWNTFPAWLPVRPLDGLFVRGDLAVRSCYVCRNEVAAQASDHLPLVAELEVLPSG